MLPASLTLISIFVGLAAAICPSGYRPACCSGLTSASSARLRQSLVADGVFQSVFANADLKVGLNCAETADLSCSAVHNPMIARLQSTTYVSVCCKGTAVHDGTAIVDCKAAA